MPGSRFNALRRAPNHPAALIPTQVHKKKKKRRWRPAPLNAPAVPSVLIDALVDEAPSLSMVGVDDVTRLLAPPPASLRIEARSGLLTDASRKDWGDALGLYKLVDGLAIGGRPVWRHAGARDRCPHIRLTAGWCRRNDLSNDCSTERPVGIETERERSRRVLATRGRLRPNARPPRPGTVWQGWEDDRWVVLPALTCVGADAVGRPLNPPKASTRSRGTKDGARAHGTSQGEVLGGAGGGGEEGGAGGGGGAAASFLSSLFTEPYTAASKDASMRDTAPGGRTRKSADGAIAFLTGGRLGAASGASGADADGRNAVDDFLGQGGGSGGIDEEGAGGGGGSAVSASSQAAHRRSRRWTRH